MNERFPINKFTLQFPPTFERDYIRDRGLRDIPGAAGLLIAATIIGVLILWISWLRVGIETIPMPSFIAQIVLCALAPVLVVALRFEYTKTHPSFLPRVGSFFAAVCIATIIAFAPIERISNVFIMSYAVLIIIMIMPLAFTEHVLSLLVMGLGIGAALFYRNDLDYKQIQAFLGLIVFASCCLSVSSYMLDRARRVAYIASLNLANEQEWSDKLLASILPRRFMDRLRSSVEDRQAIVESHAEVTIVFADLVGFTELAAKLSPHRLVALLNDLFSMFDQITDSYGAEKIKTIGDAYLAVTGLGSPRDSADHVRTGVDLALAFRAGVRDFVAKDGTPLKIRIGIHCGPVVAGVIGTSRFHFDLWGEAVNMAARLESSGVTDEIQVSAAVRERLGDDYLVETRRETMLKGIGSVETYLVKSRRL